jgi:hypothetical protein
VGASKKAVDRIVFYKAGTASDGRGYTVETRNMKSYKALGGGDFDLRSGLGLGLAH